MTKSSLGSIYKQLNVRFDLDKRLARTDDARRVAGDGIEAIVRQAAGWSGWEVAMFCQQVASHLGDAHESSMTLTVFTNRLIEAMPG